MATQDDSAGTEAVDDASDVSIVREEARYVLDGQLQILRETDQKAMATARVVSIILGLLLSAASLTDSPSDSVNGWIGLGSALLLGSLLVAVLTYSVDRPSYGIGPGYIDGVDGEVETWQSVEQELLGHYADWISDNNEEIGSNSTYLVVSQWLLVLGLSVVAVGLYRLL